ncbi:S1 RNA-binding domain-containing protein [Seongchinamella sediminis]|uniref:S1 RNA-binding domain-containing protein n=1 Tax=Seongchinamella sediminis TaxID=2283635 RepID=A0A3L7E1Y7_9GAMM|nr:Tex family protein [Seongchinamella sediminis]RLQ22343.1 S1 RNA-binding domain-containing protein [Seongchinamella sediminis]
MTKSISQRIAEELAVREAQVNAAIGLLDEGATVPFIARYRKEVTGELDDSQMRLLEERLHYLREMEERRASILASIEEQGKLTPALKQSLLEAETKNRLEDLYLPYKPKRRTKAQIAREAGLEPLADSLLADPEQDPETLARQYLNPDAGINDSKAALDGARQILMERFAEDADLLATLRQFLTDNAQLASRLVAGKEQEGAKFRDYFEHTEALAGVPSHRALAMFRGRNEGILNISLVMHADEQPTDTHPCEAMVAAHWNIVDRERPADRWLREAVRWTWRVKLLTHLQTDLLGQLRERAEAEAIEVFANNLKDLLLAAPAGQKATIGLDPGLRTGVKLAVIDANGKVLDHGAIFPNPPQKRVQEAEATLLHMIRQYQVELIAIGNGTAGRETDRFVGEILKANPELNCRKVMVNEAGASIYSASEFAAREFPDLDVTIRGAISIARRLQDPLAELVKIEPKSIGVGQYQHDVSQVQLARQLDAVVEDCVNAVGVDVNTASVPLLTRVSGLNQSIATNIVQLRDAQGSFANRQALLKVSRFGDKTFEQAAGFLRVSGGDNPLDASAVHPESYGVVERIAANCHKEVRSLIGDSSFLRALNAADYTSDSVGLPTVQDIIAELDKPGRDPRPEFKMAAFQDGVEKISDLRPDMVLEGTVTNVTNFGAFVDIGVHQDGLVHISALAEKFVKDPRDVVKAGDIVKVKVMEVDEPRKRIGLSMRLSDKAGEQSDRRGGQKRRSDQGHRGKKPRQEKPAANSAFAAAFANARQRK